MPCKEINKKVWCDTFDESFRYNAGFADKALLGVADTTVEIAQGIGDTIHGLYTLPDNTVGYLTGRDKFFGKPESWSKVGNALTLWDNPITRGIDITNSFVYGGLDLVSGRSLHWVFNEKLAMGVKYFHPAPNTIRGISADVSMAVVMGATPALKARSLKALGIEAQPKPPKISSNSRSLLRAKSEQAQPKQGSIPDPLPAPSPTPVHDVIGSPKPKDLPPEGLLEAAIDATVEAVDGPQKLKPGLPTPSTPSTLLELARQKELTFEESLKIARELYRMSKQEAGEFSRKDVEAIKQLAIEGSEFSYRGLIPKTLHRLARYNEDLRVAAVDAAIDAAAYAPKENAGLVEFSRLLSDLANRGLITDIQYQRITTLVGESRDMAKLFIYLTHKKIMETKRKTPKVRVEGEEGVLDLQAFRAARDNGQIAPEISEAVVVIVERYCDAELVKLLEVEPKLISVKQVPRIVASIKGGVLSMEVFNQLDVLKKVASASPEHRRAVLTELRSKLKTNEILLNVFGPILREHPGLMVPEDLLISLQLGRDGADFAASIIKMRPDLAKPNAPIYDALLAMAPYQGTAGSLLGELYKISGKPPQLKTKIYEGLVQAAHQSNEGVQALIEFCESCPAEKRIDYAEIRSTIIEAAGNDWPEAVHFLGRISGDYRRNSFFGTKDLVDLVKQAGRNPKLIRLLFELTERLPWDTIVYGYPIKEPQAAPFTRAQVVDCMIEAVKSGQLSWRVAGDFMLANHNYGGIRFSAEGEAILAQFKSQPHTVNAADVHRLLNALKEYDSAN